MQNINPSCIKNSTAIEPKVTNNTLYTTDASKINSTIETQSEDFSSDCLPPDSNGMVIHNVSGYTSVKNPQKLQETGSTSGIRSPLLSLDRLEESSWRAISNRKSPEMRTTDQFHFKNSTAIEPQETSDCVGFTDISTINSTIETLPGNSTSEFLPPDSSNNNNSTNVSSFIEVIPKPVKVDVLTVPFSKQKSKQHFCVFCKTLQCKIARHFCLRHKKENMVKMAMALPKGNRKRREIFDKLRKKGDFIHNTAHDKNTGSLIVTRRQQSEAYHKADHYVCCVHCKGYYSITSARTHISKCSNKKNKRNNFIEGRKITQYVHELANTEIKTAIFPVLRNDEITKAIRYDELIIRYGNRLSEKLPDIHHHDQIRANMRLLGRFKIECIKLHPEIKELKEIFKPH
ncbi:uncharacterized protein LOC131803465 [Musca domestica]|uniref:Uncharacterized protein LOC131803465 n=1 Tax=Musca domestica TaxID=7370 RepID=A0ABM3V4U8_MUSDO|nr:uncharacterized protein LOC131803465 [Musca domestica]